MKTFNKNKTLIEVYSKNEVTEEIALCPLDYVGEKYILIFPYMDKQCALEANVNNKNIYITFERDSYEIPYNKEGLKKISEMSQIWYDSENIELIRTFLNINN